MTSQGCLSFMSPSAVDIISWMKNVVFLFLALCHRLELSTHNKWTQMVNISTRCCGEINVSRKCVENVLFPPAVVRTRGTWHVWVFAHSPNNWRECGGRYRQILFLTRLSGICPIYPPLDTRNNIVWCSRLRALVAGQHSPNTAQKIF